MKPFNIGQAGNGEQMSYIGSDGYLYTGGAQVWGKQTFFKQTNAGTNIVDHEISPDYGIIVNSTGQVKVGAANANSTTAWNTVSVGSPATATGSNNKAVAVSMGQYNQLVLMANGKLYVSNGGVTSMTTPVTFDNSSTGGIVDISMGTNYQYVLFGNGDLYGASKGATSMSRIAQNVTMFDHDGYGNYIYIYDGSMIKYADAKGINTHTWSNLLNSNRSDVVQIRGSYRAGWGFLTSSGTLYTMETSSKYNTQWNGSNHTRSVTNVDYFDASAYYTWGYLKGGQIYLWCPTNNQITSNTSPGVPSTSLMPNNSGLTAPDLDGNNIPSINSSPPAMNFPKKKLIIN